MSSLVQRLLKADCYNFEFHPLHKELEGKSYQLPQETERHKTLERYHISELVEIQARVEEVRRGLN